MKMFAITLGHVESQCPFLDSPQKLRNSPPMAKPPPTMKPMRWLAHLPLVILPFLAAAAIQGRQLDRAMPFTGSLDLLGFHWFWMVVALALGVWVGWRTAGDADVESPPGDGA